MAVSGEASIVKMRMVVRRRFWRRVKIVYGVEASCKGSRIRSKGLALDDIAGTDPAVSGADVLAGFAIASRQITDASPVCSKMRLGDVWISVY